VFTPTYFDWNASAPLDEAVREAMLPWLCTRYGNASSRHEYGRQALAALDQARRQVAAAVGADFTEVIFTSGGSEANNLFLKGAAALMKPGRLAISAIEHPCVREPAQQLRKLFGWTLDTIGVDSNGRIDAQSWREELAAKPKLCSVMLANNETGAVQPVGEMAPEARAQGVIFHTDAVQALGKIDVDFRALGVDALTLSSHKIGGPIGAGALVLSKRIELAPLIAGGGQERGLRSGTENIAAIVGFGRACELVQQRREQYAQQVRRLRDELEVWLLAHGVTVFARETERLANTSFFAFPGIDGETLVGKLDRAGYAVASGSACSSANPEPSHVLLAMGVAPELARGAVRVSLGPTTTAEDMQGFIAVLERTVNELKGLAAVNV
jgi:cysteine desulfurase